MNIIAVDDEKLALRDLTQILELVLPEASVSGFRTPQEALAHAWAVPVDIAFLERHEWPGTGKAAQGYPGADEYRVCHRIFPIRC